MWTECAEDPIIKLPHSYLAKQIYWPKFACKDLNEVLITTHTSIISWYLDCSVIKIFIINLEVSL